MRSPEEFMERVLSFAREDTRIRAVGMEGSRVNPNIPDDIFKDYDITWFVEDIAAFTGDDVWLEAFGHVIMLQKPEDMELFPAVEEGYSYLILFDDYSKMDLTLLEAAQLPGYLEADSLRTILLDKDGRVGREVVAGDQDYWLAKPGPRSFDDCCNEFWNLTPYVVKGLCRKEILFAIDHLHLLRDELLRMFSWRVGCERGFDFSVGKHYKFLGRYLPAEEWEELLLTYRESSYEEVWQALFRCHAMFRRVSGQCAEAFGYAYPEYDGNITRYTEYFYRKMGL